MNALSIVPKKSIAPVKISPVQDIIADMAAGKIVILVDEEDRENEGDLVLASDFVTAYGTLWPWLDMFDAYQRALRTTAVAADGDAQRWKILDGFYCVD
jgi:hypothetical protein